MAYSEQQRRQIVNTICEKLVDGYSLRKVLKEIKSISASTFFDWIENDEVFQKQYARATDERAVLLFEEILDIADDATNDWMNKSSDDTTAYSLNGENIQRSKLRIDSRKWQLSKMQPKKYGDKLDIVSDGEKIQAGFPTLEQFYGKVETSNE